MHTLTDDHNIFGMSTEYGVLQQQPMLKGISGPYGQWGTWAMVAWEEMGCRGIGYMGHMGNGGTGAMGHRGYGTHGQWGHRGQWGTGVWGTLVMGHIGNGAHGQWPHRGQWVEWYGVQWIWGTWAIITKKKFENIPNIS